MSQRWALVDSAGIVEQVVLWDGTPYVAPVYDDDGQVLEPARGWQVPDDLDAVALDDGSPVRPGDRIDDDGQVLEVAPPAELELELGLEARVAELERSLGLRPDG